MPWWLNKSFNMHLKFNLSSRCISRCFWCETVSTGISLKNIFGWAESSFSWDDYFCEASVGSGLKSFFNLKAHFEINERSWVRSLTLSFLSLTLQKLDVLSTSSFILLFNPLGMSLAYIRKRIGPNMNY